MEYIYSQITLGDSREASHCATDLAEIYPMYAVLQLSDLNVFIIQSKVCRKCQINFANMLQDVIEFFKINFAEIC